MRTFARKIATVLAIYSILFLPLETAAIEFRATEVLSVRTGSGVDNVGNQFGRGVIIDPFNGFAVDSKGNIFISDPVNSRILKFSSRGLLLDWLRFPDRPRFLPNEICINGENLLYVYDTRYHDIVVFSSSGSIANIFSPGTTVGESNADITVISLNCTRAHGITVTFGIEGKKGVGTVYRDEYDGKFNVVARQRFESEKAYYVFFAESEQGIKRVFRDRQGNTYGHIWVPDWYGKFLPLNKYSSRGDLLGTIDGELLTRQTGYNVYDYHKMTRGGGFGGLAGRDLLIVNWYVTGSGDIYTLLANNDYVKVLRIEEE